DSAIVNTTNNEVCITDPASALIWNDDFYATANVVDADKDAPTALQGVTAVGQDDNDIYLQASDITGTILGNDVTVRLGAGDAATYGAMADSLVLVTDDLVGPAAADE
ncbi:MAG: hypothetical protein ACPHV3_00660, partial [Vibrio sp.]